MKRLYYQPLKHCCEIKKVGVVKAILRKFKIKMEEHNDINGGMGS